MTQCPTNFGRRNKFRQVADQVEFLKKHSLLKVKRDRLLLENKEVPGDMFVVGELIRRNRPAMGVLP
jgi:2-oxoglutarate ferredoxin oxidoreductase subunit beta